MREFRSSLPSLLHAAGERVFSGISRPGEGEERRGEKRRDEDRIEERRDEDRIEERRDEDRIEERRDETKEGKFREDRIR